jgi:hypothetical protein
MHLTLWITVVIVWIFAWQRQPEPMGPPFNFAASFIKSVDFAVSPLVSNLAVSLALKSQRWAGADLGLAYTLLFACLILLLGTLQWFLIGRFIQWLGTKRRALALLSISGAVSWVLYCILAWSGYWANW